MSRLPPIPFREIAAASAEAAEVIVPRWLPGGRLDKGREWVALNPTRADKHAGSFTIRVTGERAGVWCDFATREKGADLIDLGCYLFGWSKVESARNLAHMVGHPFGADQDAAR